MPPRKKLTVQNGEPEEPENGKKAQRKRTEVQYHESEGSEEEKKPRRKRAAVLYCESEDTEDEVVAKKTKRGRKKTKKVPKKEEEKEEKPKINEPLINYSARDSDDTPDEDDDLCFYTCPCAGCPEKFKTTETQLFHWNLCHVTRRRQISDGDCISIQMIDFENRMNESFEAYRSY